jgi:predicted nucleic acid-binding protein
MDIPALVLDTSAAMALFFRGKEGEQVEELIHRLISSNGQIFVPSLFWYEAGNTLITAFRRDRLSIEDIRGIETDLGELPIITDPVPDSAVRMRIREIAQSSDLSYYDAAYIEISQRLQLRLVTYDKRLLDALGNLEI